jgi:hypothetical protein
MDQIVVFPEEPVPTGPVIVAIAVVAGENFRFALRCNAVDVHMVTGATPADQLSAEQAKRVRTAVWNAACRRRDVARALRDVRAGRAEQGYVAVSLPDRVFDVTTPPMPYVIEPDELEDE